MKAKEVGKEISDFIGITHEKYYNLSEENRHLTKALSNALKENKKLRDIVRRLEEKDRI